MEDTEIGIWPAHVALTPSFSGVGRQTLNEDPSNVLAEQLAMDHCTKGFDVVQEMTETELVTTSCGHIIPGTPDGGFTDSNGLLRLVQVVRVPLLPGMDADEVSQTLYDTVLVKIVKSQAWMKHTGIFPHDFIIFCWLPPVGSYEVCLEQSDELLWTESLMSNVRDGGWPFSLRVEVPTDPGGMFPTCFGQVNHERNFQSYLDGLCYFLSPADFEASDDDEVMQWYLFDEDFDETTDKQMINEAAIDAQARYLRIVIALAIQFLEQAAEAQHGVNVDLWLETSIEDDCAAPMLHKAFSLIPNGSGSTYRGYRVAREKSKPAPVLIEGLSWWDFGSAFTSARCSLRGDLHTGLMPPLQCPSLHNVLAVFDPDRVPIQFDASARSQTTPSPLAKVELAQRTIKGSAAMWIPQCPRLTDLEQLLTVSGKSCRQYLWLSFKAALLCF